MSGSPFAALLLAGGQSRRMGRPKAFLDVGGVPLWQSQMRKLQAAHPSQIFVSIHLPFPEGPWTVVTDSIADRGPLAGLLAAMERISLETRLLVLSVDTPAIREELLARLLAESTPECGIVPRVRMRVNQAVIGNPFIGTVAVYPSKILPLLRKAVHSEDRSFQTFIRCASAHLQAWDVPEELEPQFKNLNTPEEYQEFLDSVTQAPHRARLKLNSNEI